MDSRMKLDDSDVVMPGGGSGSASGLTTFGQNTNPKLQPVTLNVCIFQMFVVVPSPRCLLLIDSTEIHPRSLCNHFWRILQSDQLLQGGTPTSRVLWLLAPKSWPGTASSVRRWAGLRTHHLCKRGKCTKKPETFAEMKMFFHAGGGARTQTTREQRTTSGQVGGVPGPGGPSEGPRKDQRAGVQRGEEGPLVWTFCPGSWHVFIPLMSVVGRHAILEEGGVEVPAGFLSMDQHHHRATGHPAHQNVNLFSWLWTSQWIWSQVCRGAACSYCRCCHDDHKDLSGLRLSLWCFSSAVCIYTTDEKWLSWFFSFQQSCEKSRKSGLLRKTDSADFRLLFNQMYKIDF